MEKKNKELEQVIEACKQLQKNCESLQKTCETIVKAMTFMQTVTLMRPMMEQVLEEYIKPKKKEKCVKQKKVIKK